MAAPRNPRPDHAQLIDAFFAGLHDDTGYPLGTGSFNGDDTPPDGIAVHAGPEQAEAATLAPLTQSGDPRAIAAWIQQERRRLAEYTQQQFAAIHQQKEALVRHQAEIDRALVLRQQELNRQAHVLGAYEAELQSRKQQWSEREAALTAQMDRLAGAEHELTSLQQTTARVQEDNDSQRILQQELNSEGARLQEAARVYRAEVIALQQEISRYKGAFEEQQRNLAARMSQLEERFIAVENREAALFRRTRELDEMETQIRKELEERERQLDLESREIESLRNKLRSQAARST